MDVVRVTCRRCGEITATTDRVGLFTASADNRTSWQHWTLVQCPVCFEWLVTFIPPHISEKVHRLGVAIGIIQPAWERPPSDAPAITMDDVLDFHNATAGL